MASKKSKSKAAKKTAPAPKSPTSGELSEAELDGVSGGALGYGGKLQLASNSIEQTVQISPTTINTLGYGG